VCHETIYQAVYHGGKGGLSRQLTRRLRTGRPLRKRRRRANERTPRFVAPAVLIDRRPPVVETRGRLGDWEGDLITGRVNQSAIGTLVDRASRYVKLIHLPDRHSAESLRDALTLAVVDLPSELRRTLTWDQGSEMAHHDQIAHLFSDGIFFAYPGRPWERPSNENTNGLLRQYFPKRTDLSIHTPEDLHVVEERLNNRPRKTLGWRTPAEVLAAGLRSG
jgi:IS30 family transposase